MNSLCHSGARPTLYYIANTVCTANTMRSHRNARIVILLKSRLTVVSCEAKKAQSARPTKKRDHYCESFT